VDLDPDMTALPRRFPPLAALNEGSLDDPRVTTVNDDAMIWLERAAPTQPFDAAIVDFPDPNSFSVGKLYTTRFYELLQSRLAPEGTVAVQATSPLFARKAYWSIVETLRAAGYETAPYAAAVPSFGIWGFVLARRTPFDPPRRAPPGLRFLDDETLSSLFRLSPDLGPVPAEVNRLDNQTLVRIYESEWRRWD
jgi:spermidine synthase